MASFRYIAIGPTGERQSGLLNAPSEQAVVAELERRRLTPVSLDAVADASPRNAGGRISTGRLATAYTQLGELLGAGVPLLRALRLLGRSKASPALARVFSGLAEEVSHGSELAAAMATRPAVFKPVHVALVRAGEKGGFLEEATARLGQLLSKQAALRQALISAMIYPAMLVGFGLLLLTALFVFFIPQFRELFAEVQLPLPTRIVFGIADLATKWGVVTAGVLIGLAVLASALARRPAVSARVSRAMMRVPVLGALLRAVSVARFARVLGTLLGNGVPMLAGLQIARDAAGTPVMREAIERATEAVRAGQALADPLEASGVFDEDVVEIVRVAEAANNLDTVLVNVADTVEARIDRLLGVALKLVEPIMLVLLGGAVGFIALALILPMLKMASGIGQEI